MKKKHDYFIWLDHDCDWGGGRLMLRKGEKYEARLVDADVLAGWVKAGAAKMVEAKEE